MSILICLLTIYAASRADLMYDNITIVAGNEHYRFFVIALTIFMAFFYAYKVHKIFYQLPDCHKIYHIMIVVTCLMMSIGSFFPYTIGGKDILSQIHVFCSFFSCALFLILLFIYTKLISISCVERYLKMRLHQ